MKGSTPPLRTAVSLPAGRLRPAGDVLALPHGRNCPDDERSYVFGALARPQHVCEPAGRCPPGVLCPRLPAGRSAGQPLTEARPERLGRKARRQVEPDPAASLSHLRPDFQQPRAPRAHLRRGQRGPGQRVLEHRQQHRRRQMEQETALIRQTPVATGPSAGEIPLELLDAILARPPPAVVEIRFPPGQINAIGEDEPGGGRPPRPLGTQPPPRSQRAQLPA